MWSDSDKQLHYRSLWPRGRATQRRLAVSLGDISGQRDRAPAAHNYHRACAPVSAALPLPVCAIWRPGDEQARVRLATERVVLNCSDVTADMDY